MGTCMGTPSSCNPGADPTGVGAMCGGCERSVVHKRMYTKKKKPVLWNDVILYATSSGSCVSPASDFLLLPDRNGSLPRPDRSDLKLLENDLIFEVNGISTFGCSPAEISRFVDSAEAAVVNITVKRKEGPGYCFYKVQVQKSFAANRAECWSPQSNALTNQPPPRTPRAYVSPQELKSNGYQATTKSPHNESLASTPRSIESSSSGNHLLDLGICCIKTGAGTIVVSKVLPDSPALRCGMIRRGDRLVEIDNNPAELLLKGGFKRAQATCDGTCLVFERNVGEMRESGFTNVPPMVIRVRFKTDGRAEPFGENYVEL